MSLATAILMAHPNLHAMKGLRVSPRTSGGGDDYLISTTSECRDAEVDYHRRARQPLDVTAQLMAAGLPVAEIPARRGWAVSLSRVGFDTSCSTAFVSMFWLFEEAPGTEQVDPTLSTEYTCISRSADGWTIAEASSHPTLFERSSAGVVIPATP